jgi:hypothetical protein
MEKADFLINPPKYHQQSERLPSPRPPFPRPSSSPPLLRPSLLPLHSMPYCTASCVVWCAMLPARVRSGPREHQRRARSDDEVPWSPSSIDYRRSVLVCDRKDNRYNTRVRVVYQHTSILRFLSFVPLTPELTTHLSTCFVLSHLPHCSCLRTHMHIVPVLTRSTVTGYLLKTRVPLYRQH